MAVAPTSAGARNVVVVVGNFWLRARAIRQKQDMSCRIKLISPSVILSIYIKPHQRRAIGQPLLRMAAHASDWGNSLNQRRTL
jgi:hypothetical protein